MAQAHPIGVAAWQMLSTQANYEDPLGSRSANVVLCSRRRWWRHPGCGAASQRRGGRRPEEVDAVSRSELISAAHMVTDDGLVPDGWPWSRMA